MVAAPPPVIVTPPATGKGGPVEDEVMAFNAATNTGIKRHMNEDAATYTIRAKTVSRAQAAPLTDATLVESVMDDLVEAHRILSAKDTEIFVQRVEGRVNKLGLVVGIPRDWGEPMMDYVSRLQTTLRTRGMRPPPPAIQPPPAEEQVPEAPKLSEPTAEEAPPAEAPATVKEGEEEGGSTLDVILHPPIPSAAALPSGLPWVLSLYRGFLKSYFSPIELDNISDEMIASSSKLQEQPASENELIVYSRLLKNAIQSSQKSKNAKIDIEKVLGDFDQFVETLSELQQK
jgi:hypothetical protein